MTPLMAQSKVSLDLLKEAGYLANRICVMRARPGRLYEEIATDLGMTLTDERAAEFLGLMQGNFDAYELLEQMSDYKPEVKYPRTPGYRPEELAAEGIRRMEKALQQLA